MFLFLCEEKNGFRRFVFLFPSGLLSSFSKCPRPYAFFTPKCGIWWGVISSIRTTFYVGVHRRTRVNWRYNQWNRNGKHCSCAAIELWMHAGGCQARKKGVMWIVKNLLSQLKRLCKLFLSTNTKTFANYRITTKYNLLESEAYDFKRR